MQHPNISAQESQIALALAPALKSAGFDWLPRLHQFRRSHEEGFSCLILSLSEYETDSLIEAHLGLRIDHVENLAFPFTNGLPGFQPDSMSLVTPMARLFGKRFERLTVTDEASIGEAVQHFREQLAEKGLPFLQQYSRLQSLDELINDNPQATVPLLHNQINRCFRAIVTAKLLQRPDFLQLTAHYRQFLEEELYAPAQTLEKYERLRHFLEQYSMN